MLSITHNFQSQSISNLFTNENVYKGTAIITTVALTALNLYAPYLSAGATIAMTGINILAFNKAVLESQASSTKSLQRWIVCSALIASCALTALSISTCTLYLSSRLPFVSTNRVLLASFPIGIIGFGMPVARSLYKKGLELSAKPIWSEMERYLGESRRVKGSINSIFKKIYFMGTILLPEFSEWFADSHLPVAIQAAGLRFASDAQKEKYIKSFLDTYDYIPVEYHGEQMAVYRNAVIGAFHALSDERQWVIFQEMLRVLRLHKETIEQALSASNRNKLAEILHTLPSRVDRTIHETREKLELLSSRFIQETENGKKFAYLDEGKLFYSSATKELLAIEKEVQLFMPDLKKAELSQLHRELITGPVIQEIERLNGLTVKDQVIIDREQPTWDYFLIQWGQEAMNELKRLFNASSLDINEFDNLLVENKIGTVGEFIDVVLDKNQAILNDQEAVFEKLNEYLSIRNQAYKYVIGDAVSTRPTLTHTAMKIAYRAVIVFTTVAPIISHPEFFAAGAICYVLYRCAPQKVQNFVLRHLKRFMSENLLDLIMEISLERPLFRVLSFNPPPESRAYDRANFFAQMRILSTELFYGLILNSASVSHLGRPDGTGSAIHGINVAREVVDSFVKKATRHIQRWSYRRIGNMAPLSV